MEEYFEDIIHYLENEKCVFLLGPNVALFPEKKSVFDGAFETLNVSSGVFAEKDQDGLFRFEKGRDRVRFPDMTWRYVNEHLSPNRIHEILTEIPSHLMISLSPDQLQLQAFEDKGMDSQQAYYHKKSPQSWDGEFSKENPLIFNFFGLLSDPGSLIFTQDDLFDFLFELISKRSPVPPTIEHAVFEARMFIFLGFDFEQWYLKLILRILKLHEDPVALAAGTSKDLPVSLKLFYERQFELVFLPEAPLEYLERIHAACEQKGILRKGTMDQVNSLQGKVRNLIRKDLLEDALDLLIDELNEQDSFTKNQCLQLSGSLTGLNRKLAKGTIYPEPASVQRAQIREGLLGIIDQLDD